MRTGSLNSSVVVPRDWTSGIAEYSFAWRLRSPAAAGRRWLVGSGAVGVGRFFILLQIGTLTLPRWRRCDALRQN